MRGQIITATGIAMELALETCYSCGVPFGIPTDLRRRFLEQGRSATFYCPNGHGQSYTKSVTAKLEEARADAVHLQAQLTEAWEDATRKGNALAALRKRVKAERAAGKEAAV